MWHCHEESKEDAPNGRSGEIYLIMRTGQETLLSRLADIRNIIEHGLLHPHLDEPRECRSRDLNCTTKNTYTTEDEGISKG